MKNPNQIENKKNEASLNNQSFLKKNKMEKFQCCFPSSNQKEQEKHLEKELYSSKSPKKEVLIVMEPNKTSQKHDGQQIIQRKNICSIIIKSPEDIGSDDDDEIPGPSAYIGSQANLLGTSVNFNFKPCSKAKFLTTSNPYKKRSGNQLPSPTQKKQSILSDFMSSRLRTRKLLQEKGKDIRSNSSNAGFYRNEVVRKFNDYSLAGVRKIRSELVDIHLKDKERLLKLPKFKSFRNLFLSKSATPKERKPSIGQLEGAIPFSFTQNLVEYTSKDKKTQTFSSKLKKLSCPLTTFQAISEKPQEQEDLTPKFGFNP